MHYAKADPDDLLMTVEVTNAGPDADVLHVLPTAWFRNTWSWERERRAGRHGGDRPDDASAIPHPFLGELELVAGPGPDGTQPELLFCDNETNAGRLYGAAGARVPEGRHQRPRRGGRADREPRAARAASAPPGTGCAVAPGETVELRLRLRPRPGAAVDLGTDFDAGARRAGGPRPTSSTPSSPPRRRPRTRRW